MVNTFSKEQIEKLENSYLEEFYHFLKYAQSRMLEGFQTGKKIKEDWISKWQSGTDAKGISSFDRGAERIIYALFNAQGFGQPNSSPIGSDLMFETKDAFIHIDLKTVQTRNIGDYSTCIFIGDNQNSYSGKIEVQGKSPRNYEAALPPIYKNSGDPKLCLTYFITILYEEKTLNILNINILSMPNGLLNDEYGSAVLKAGKNPGKIRFNFSRVDKFKLLDKKPKRIKVVYFNESMDKQLLKKLDYIHSIYKAQ